MPEFPIRKKIRLKDFDYSQNGCYFVTVCTKDRQPLFGESVGADIIRPNLSEYGKIVDTAINAIVLHYPNIIIGEYVIMPNHIHMILIISDNKNGRMLSAPTKPLPTIIGQMKRWVSKEIGFSVWQKSYYEHIIRDEKDYLTKSEYIKNNPYKAKTDN